MAAQEGKLQDELLPELEFYVIPSKFTDKVRVDIGNFDEPFVDYLVSIGCIADDVHNDCQIMPSSKFPKFCKTVRDAFRNYNIGRNADI